jgi:hypothetical protein
MEPEGSILCSQEPSTGPYSEPYPSNPQHLILSPRAILILFTHLRLGLPSGFFLLASQPISYMHSSSPPFVTISTKCSQAHPFNISFLTHFPYFEKIKECLWDHPDVCVSCESSKFARQRLLLNVAFYMRSVSYQIHVQSSSMALHSFFRPWPLFEFLNPKHSRLDSLDGGSARRKATTYKQNKTNRE